MIRKNSLFCNLIRIKSSSKDLFYSFMGSYDPDKDTCPECGAVHTCQFHASYERNLIDFIAGRAVYHKIIVDRVICSSCGHSHAVLPDMIIPYSTYGIFFILRVIAEYLLRHRSVEYICSKFGISHSMLYRWYSLFLSHKKEWLGILSSAETSPLAFCLSLTRLSSFSDFSSSFVLKMAVSFMQNHANPSQCRQTHF